MRCHVCDKAMQENEIVYLPETNSFDCCATCLDVALEAAFSDGFQKEEPLDDPELEELFGDGLLPVLDPDTYRSVLDHCDASYFVDNEEDE